MKICEYAFAREDEDNPGYSMHEVDYYAWIPAAKRGVMPNHRLSLRRNLVDKVWEFYRAFSNTVLLEAKTWKVITHKPTGTEAVAFTTKDFAEALRWGNNEWNLWHWTSDYTREPDVPCDHGWNKSLSCPINCPEDIQKYELDQKTSRAGTDNRNQETS